MKKITGNLIILILFAPMFLFGTTIIVDINGSGHYTSIQEGIDNARTSDTVLVYPGTYTEIVDFSGKDIVLASLFLTTQDTSYIAQTIIDGANEQCQLVRFTNGETENAQLIGFTVTNASAQSDKSGERFYEGLGIYIDGSSPIIERNRIVDNDFNEWYWNGGGIVLKSSSAKIRNNLIRKNEMAFSGGGIYMINCNDVSIENNIIEDNYIFSGYGVSEGAGIYIDSSFNINITNNVICDNLNDFGYGGGLCIRWSYNVNIINNNFSENWTVLEGGAIYTASVINLKITGNVFQNNNVARRGGGLAFIDTDLIMTNNTIAFNAAIGDYSKGGALYCENSSPEIYNTIFYFNTSVGSGNQVYLNANADPDFYYCDIEGGVEAFGLADTVVYNGHYENNIDEDPQFVQSGDYPFSTEIGSPCNNAGSPDTAGLALPELDLAHNPRIVGPSIDIGAYENQLATSVRDHVPAAKILLSPNPVKDKLQISIPEELFADARVIIVNMHGKTVLAEPLKSSVQDFNLQALAPGLYVLKVLSSGVVFEEKLVVD